MDKSRKENAKYSPKSGLAEGVPSCEPFPGTLPEHMPKGANQKPKGVSAEKSGRFTIK